MFNTKIILSIIKNLFSYKFLRYINFNKKIFLYPQTKKNKVALIEMHHNFPLIFLWSFVINYLVNKRNVQFFYFYMPIFKNNSIINLSYEFFLKIIYSSLNVKKLNLDKLLISDKFYRNLYKKKIKNKEDLINFKKKQILFGDLIYNSYLRKNFKPTVFNINDEELIQEFIRANKYFDKIYNYFKKNSVDYIVSSHTYYYECAIPYRIGSKFKSNLIKILDTGIGYQNYSLFKLDRKFNLNFPPYYNYKEFFVNQIKNKSEALKIGRKIILKRIDGKIDANIGFMKKTSFKKEKKNIFNNKNNKIKIVLFAHCFFDSPHRFRYLLFNDFYDFLISTAEFVKKNKNFELYIKPHPYSMKENQKYFKQLKKIYLNVDNIKFIDSKISNLSIINSKPDLVLTCHGTVAHEMAYFKIPVINAGDNLHSNYDFSLNPKSKKDYFKMIKNINVYSKKINFNKSKIYEYIYLNNYYFYNRFQKKKFAPDKMFFNKKVFEKNKIDHTDIELLNYYSKFNNKDIKNIKKYVQIFFEREILC